MENLIQGMSEIYRSKVRDETIAAYSEQLVEAGIGIIEVEQACDFFKKNADKFFPTYLEFKTKCYQYKPQGQIEHHVDYIDLAKDESIKFYKKGDKTYRVYMNSQLITVRDMSTKSLKGCHTFENNGNFDINAYLS